ncbi:MAG: hypothetical protein R2688_07760 [Fimbriimonadaceae bacterium]
MTDFWHWSDAPSGDYAVVGDPVSHSLSPRIHAAAYQEHGLHLTYRAIQVRSGELAEAIDVLRGRGYKGLNVTVPLKTEALDWCCRVEPEAERMGAVNTLNLENGEGTNTDAPGFLQTLGNLGISSGRVLILGAGYCESPSCCLNQCRVRYFCVEPDTRKRRGDGGSDANISSGSG